MLETVYVCTHALERWRQRVALYGDAPKQDIADAIRQARRVPDSEPLAVVKLAGSHYFRDDARGVTFVVERIDDASCRVITVCVDGVPDEAVLTPKRRVKARPVKARPAVPEPTPPEPAPPCEREMTPEQVLAEYDKASEMFRGLQAHRAGFTRSHPEHARLSRELVRVQRRLEQLRPARQVIRFRLHAQKQKAPENLTRAGIYQNDGAALDYNLALHYLLRRVDELQAEVDALKRQ